MREDIIKKLKSLKPILKERFGIEEIALFGSVARDEVTATSDVDIAIIKIEKKDPLLRLKAKEFLAQQLNKKIDLGYLQSMRPTIRRHILKEIIYV